MSKKKVKDLLPLVVLVMGVLATVLLSLKSFVLQPALGSKQIPGLGLAFGSKDDGLELNILNIIALLLPLAGGVLGFVKRDKVGHTLSTLVLGLGLVFIFLVKVSHTLLGSLTVSLTSIGILALVSLIVALVSSVVALLFDLKVL